MSEGEYALFVEKRYFIIRTTDKLWSETWSDMYIEQSLMRSMKTDGALCEAAENFDKFCGIKSAISHQHIKLRGSRIKKDDSDVRKFLEWFQQHPPFIVRNELMSLSNGIIGDESINCYESLEIGKDAMTSMP
ncbi:hypothetical protein ILUMI_14265 [Ignelater luminosus]|uniref:Uncharacterized protein n=1 Tax=Ignelater luminosus TaxID=2038154 RepID=A0A8K0CQR6_IGNLU|nr:hypothetical protein ILUMI_14265 [Ignelater luminosus]